MCNTTNAHLQVLNVSQGYGRLSHTGLAILLQQIRRSTRLSHRARIQGPVNAMERVPVNINYLSVVATPRPWQYMYISVAANPAGELRRASQLPFFPRLSGTVSPVYAEKPLPPCSPTPILGNNPTQVELLEMAIQPSRDNELWLASPTTSSPLVMPICDNRFIQAVSNTHICA